MAKYKFTLNLTAIFEMEAEDGGTSSYQKAQNWVLERLMDGEESTHMNIQRLDLVRWSEPRSNMPIDADTGKPMARSK